MNRCGNVRTNRFEGVNVFRINAIVDNRSDIEPTEANEACKALIPDWLGNRGASCLTSLVFGWIEDDGIDMIVDIAVGLRNVSQRELEDLIGHLESRLSRKLVCTARVVVSLNEQFVAPSQSATPSPRSIDFRQ